MYYCNKNTFDNFKLNLITKNEGLIINKNKKIIVPDREKLVKFFKEN